SALSQRIRSGHADAAGARERRGYLSGAGARAEDVRERSRASRSGGSEDLEQALARDPLLDLGATGPRVGFSDLDVLFLLRLFLIRLRRRLGAGGLGGFGRKDDPGEAVRQLIQRELGFLHIGQKRQIGGPREVHRQRAEQNQEEQMIHRLPERSLGQRRQLGLRRLRRRRDELKQQG